MTGLKTTPFHPRAAALMEGAAWRSTVDVLI